MNYSILNEKHRIVAVPIQRRRPGLTVIYSQNDTILINEDAPNLEKTVEVLAAYLDLEGRERVDLKEYINSRKYGADLLRLLGAMDRVTRIRRHFLGGVLILWLDQSFLFCVFL